MMGEHVYSISMMWLCITVMGFVLKEGGGVIIVTYGLILSYYNNSLFSFFLLSLSLFLIIFLLMENIFIAFPMSCIKAMGSCINAGCVGDSGGGESGGGNSCVWVLVVMPLIIKVMYK